jgi:hypothetical protein
MLRVNVAAGMNLKREEQQQQAQGKDDFPRGCLIDFDSSVSPPRTPQAKASKQLSTNGAVSLA